MKRYLCHHGVKGMKWGVITKGSKVVAYDNRQKGHQRVNTNSSNLPSMRKSYDRKKQNTWADRYDTTYKVKKDLNVVTSNSVGDLYRGYLKNPSNWSAQDKFLYRNDPNKFVSNLSSSAISHVLNKTPVGNMMIKDLKKQGYSAIQDPNSKDGIVITNKKYLKRISSVKSRTGYVSIHDLKGE